jgi:large subunit ribosomal protein L15
MRMPRLPGYGNPGPKLRYEPVNVESLNVFSEGDIVGPADLVERGIANSGPIKILGRGELTITLTVRATRFSAGAIQKIESAGGKVEQIEVDSRTGDGDSDASIET